MDNVLSQLAAQLPDELNIGQRASLVNALLNCPSVINKRGDITSKLSFRHSIAEDPQPRMHVHSILRTSMDYPGGFVELIQAIAEHDRHTAEFEELLGCVRKLSR